MNTKTLMNKLALFASALSTAFITSSVLAQTAAESNEYDSRGLGVLAAGLGMGIAAFGGAFAQGRAAAAAFDGIARNPNASDKLFTPFILGLAFIESLVLFTFGLAYLVLGKI